MMTKTNDALWRRQKHQKTRNEILDILGRICKKCGFSDERALHIDHVCGGGSKQRKKYGGATFENILSELKEGSSEYQVLCANCNAIKRVEERELIPRKYEGEWKRKPLQPCGTPASYRRGCRCDLCVDAHRKQSREGMRKSGNIIA